MTDFIFTVADDCLCLAGLPLLLKENLLKEKPDALLMNNEQQTMGIIAETNLLAMGTNRFSVSLEKVEICRSDNFFEAYSGLLACIYVMNLAYSKALEESFLFVQNVLLELKDTTDTFDKRIVNVLSLINSELKKS
jgi:hypothetical protein